MLLGILAAILVLVTAMQAGRILTLSRYKTELTGAIHRDHDEIDRRTREAADIRRGMNPQELALVAAAAKEANGLIEQRTFSWTELFNQLEATLPENVMLTAVHPEFKDGITHVNMEIQGRRAEDNDAFFEKLEATGVFRDVSWSAEQRHRGRAPPHDHDGGVSRRNVRGAAGGRRRRRRSSKR